MTYELFIAALCLFREARGASMTAQNAVWQVIQNRANDPQHRWPKNIADVVTQPHQFSSFNRNDPNVTAWPTQGHPADWNAFVNCQTVVMNSLGNDPTNGANSYFSGSVVPDWADPAKHTVDIGPFKFYKL